jgi:hypothetical protein
MSRHDDEIASCGAYRSVPLFAGQSEARLEVVRRDIDDAHLLSDPRAFLAFLDDVSRAPEARLYCQARLLAEHELAVEDRRQRPTIDIDLVKAYGYLASRRWQNRQHHCSLLDGSPPPGGPYPVPRETPLPDED